MRSVASSSRQPSGTPDGHRSCAVESRGHRAGVAMFVAVAVLLSLFSTARSASSHTITASAGSGGSITPSGAVAVAEGGSQTFTIAADACFAIQDVLVDGVSVGAVASFPFTNVTANHTIAASFVATTIPTSMALDHTPSPSVCQQAISLTATITPSVATGSVEFFDGVTSLGVVAVVSGSAATSVPSGLTVGVHELSAVYSPSGCFVGSQVAVNHTVNKATPAVVLSSDINPSSWNQTVTFTATLSPTATGTVTFKDSLTTLGSAPVVGGMAQITKSNLYTGNHTAMTAVYSGDGCFTTRTSALYAQLVYRAASSVSMTTDVNPSGFGQTVKFTAMVSPVGGTNRVEFSVDGNLIGTAAVNALTGVAFLNVSNLVPGTHNLTVRYQGDAHYAPSTSAGPYSQVVNAVPSSTVLTAAPSPATCQSPVTLTATITPSDAGGSVEFFDGATSLGTAPASSGVASLAVGFSTGVHSLTANYSGDVFYVGSVSGPVSLTVNKAQPTVALTSGPSPSIWAQAVTLTATASPATATGTVTFKDSLATLGTAPLVGGVATFVKSNFFTGNHTQLTAVYAGDGCFKNATSPAASQLVYRAPTTVGMTTDLNPSTFGQVVKLTATVSVIGATGRVTFMDGGNPIGTAAVSTVTGVATLNASNLVPGTHSLTVAYPGDTHFESSASSPYSQTVNLSSSSVTIAVSPAAAVCQQPVTLTATLTPSDAGGTVTFLDGGDPVGTAPISGGVATLVISTLPVTIHSLSASYPGDAFYTGSSSASQGLTITRANATVAVTSDVNPSVWPNGVTFTATLPATATGTVTFKDSLTTLGVAPVVGGTASVTKGSLFTGNHTQIVATYSGDGCFKNATSPPYAQLVYRAGSSVVLTSDINPAAFGQTVKFTATVTPVGATGRVTILEGGNPIGTAAVNALTGLATLNVGNLLPGTHTMTVTYPGDTHYQPSGSGGYNEVVNKTPSSVVLAAAPSPAVCQQPVTLTATVTPGEAGGTATFYDGVSTLGSAAVVGGVATLVVSTLNVATHTLGATYDGDQFYLSSTATNQALVVGKAQPTVALVSGPSPSIWAQAVTLTATASSTAATGTVTFKDSLATLGTAPLVGGVATFVKSNFFTGHHTQLTAVYAGDGCFKNATSPPASQQVYRAPTTVGLTSDLNPSTFGQVVKLTATVSVIGATGRVTFMDGGNPIGTAAVSTVTGVATLNVGNLLPGTHDLTVAYPGDTHFEPSASNHLSQVVNLATASVVLTSDVNPSVVAQAVTLTATVSPDDANGSVEFFDGAASLGTSAVGVGGLATLVTSTLAAGTHSLTAAYGGSIAYAPATSPPYSQEVTSAVALLARGLQAGVAQLSARAADFGVEVSWALVDPSLFTNLELQRSTVEAGTWTTLDAQLRLASGTAVASDRSAESGRTYFYRLVGTTAAGTQAIFGPIPGSSGAPKEFALSAAWPNPSKGEVSLSFKVAKATHVKLGVVDLQGREVAVLANGEYVPGTYQARWSGRTAQGQAAAGVYFIRFITAQKQFVSRVAITR